MKPFLLAVLWLILSIPSAIADHFELKLWAREPLLKNPVSISMDDQGRIYVAETARRASVDLDIRQHKPWVLADLSNQSVEDFRAFTRHHIAPEKSDENQRWLPDHNGDGSHDWRDLKAVTDTVRILEDTDGDGVADHSQVYADGFNEEITGVLEGVMWHHGSNDVFATIFPDLWRLRDTDDDGKADLKESVFRGFGVHAAFDGHDIHGLTVGPDGKLYFSVGDNGMSLTTKEGNRIHHPNTGGVLRCNFDGSDLEVFAHGLRNPQEIAFDRYGYLFTVDNDGDLEDERERFVYIAEGSDSGWRLNWQFRTEGWAKYTGQPNYNPWIADGMWKPRHPDHPAHIIPPLSNYSVGPGGFRYNPGTALTERYRDHFFLVQFPVAKITSFRAEPVGAGFKMVDEHVFHQGLMVSCVEWSHEGALILADWEGKWQPNEKGAIYFYDDPKAAKDPIRLEVAKLLREELGKRQTPQLLPLLGHLDQRVRLRAQFALASRRSTEELLQLAMKTDGPQLARIHAMWGLGQIGQITHGIRLPFNDADPEIRAQAAKVAGDLRWKDATEPLVTLLSDPQPRVRFQACIALSKVPDTEVVAPLVAMLERNNDEDAFLRHAGSFALAGIGESAPLGQLTSHPSRPVRLASVVALRRMQNAEVSRFLSDPDQLVVREATRAIHDDFSIPEALEPLAQLVNNNPFHQDEAIARRLISANMRLGKPQHAEALVSYIVDQENPEPLRIEALQALGSWDADPFVDRVTGRVRFPTDRAHDAGKEAIATNIAALVASGTTAMSEAIARVAGSLGVESGNALFSKWAVSNGHPVEVRVAALNALATRKAPNLTAIVDSILKSEKGRLEMVALSILSETDSQRVSDHLWKEYNRYTLVEKQMAIDLLATIGNEVAHQSIESELQALIEGKLDLALELDVVEAATRLATKSTALQLQLDTYRKTKPGFRYALQGGDSKRGSDVFYNNVSAQCIRCHTIRSKAPGVGPDLDGIGKKFDHQYLLDSLVEPSKTISQGYALLTVEKKDGSAIGGTLLSETDEELVIATASEQQITIPKSELRNRNAAEVSSMPPMGEILSRSELRDLVEFLASLR